MDTDVIAIIKVFFQTSKMLKETNATSLTLNLNVRNPGSFMDIIPISCFHHL